MTGSNRNSAALSRNKVRRGYSADPGVQGEIARAIQSGVTSGAEIRRRLEATGHVAPSENTIRDLVAEMIARAESAEWTLATADLAEIPLVLPVWACAQTLGLRLSVQEAAWVVRIRTAAPDLPLDDVWGLAGLRVLWPDSAHAIDALLAFAPWCDVDHAERYFAAVNAGRIPSPPLAWDLAGRALKGKVAKSAVPHAIAFFQKQPKITITVKGDSVTVSTDRREAGHK